MKWITFTRTEKEVLVNADVDFEKMQPLEAAFLAIEDITNNYPAPYTLMLSGGIDSQVMLWCWLKSGKKFDVRTVRYNDGLNDHDIKDMSEFCRQHNLKFVLFDFDLLNFLEVEYSTYAERYRCSSPQICTHMKMCEDIVGTTIFSGNFADTNKLSIDEAIMGMHRYSVSSGQSVIPFFFLHTPELAFSLRQSESTLKYENRIQAYQNAGFPIIPQTKKQTGFELVKDLYDKTHAHLVTPKTKLEFFSRPSKRVFDLLLRYPYEKKFGNPTYTFLLPSCSGFSSS